MRSLSEFRTHDEFECALVIVISKRFKLSSKYERKPRELNTWSALDHGIDPTEEEKP